MDHILCVALPAQGWTGDRIRFVLASENGREVWEVTLDRLAGTGQARVIGPTPSYTEKAETRPGVANERGTPDREASDQPESVPDENSSENPM